MGTYEISLNDARNQGRRAEICKKDGEKSQEIFLLYPALSQSRDHMRSE